MVVSLTLFEPSRGRSERIRRIQQSEELPWDHNRWCVAVGHRVRDTQDVRVWTTRGNGSLQCSRSEPAHFGVLIRLLNADRLEHIDGYERAVRADDIIPNARVGDLPGVRV